MEQIPKPYSRERFQEYKAKLGQLMSEEASLEDLDKVTSALENKSIELQKKYGRDVVKYALYHVLAFSTPYSDQEFIAEDFPGEDSIAQFIDNLQIK